MVFYKTPLLIWNNGMVEKWNIIPLLHYPVVFDYGKPADLRHCSENKFIDFRIIIPVMSIGLRPIKKLAVHLWLNFSQPQWCLTPGKYFGKYSASH
jgi:hypothetical protein